MGDILITLSDFMALNCTLPGLFGTVVAGVFRGHHHNCLASSTSSYVAKKLVYKLGVIVFGYIATTIVITGHYYCHCYWLLS